jgi:hypothetical protein
MKTRMLMLSIGLAVLLGSCSKNQPATVNAPVQENAGDTRKNDNRQAFVKPDKVADFSRWLGHDRQFQPGTDVKLYLYQNPFDNTKLIFMGVWERQLSFLLCHALFCFRSKDQ